MTHTCALQSLFDRHLLTGTGALTKLTRPTQAPHAERSRFFRSPPDVSGLLLNSNVPRMRLALGVTKHAPSQKVWRKVLLLRTSSPRTPHYAGVVGVASLAAPS